MTIDLRQDARLLTPQSHPDALESGAAKALRDGDYLTAFKFADRRCRISPAPQSHCYVLRAEAAHQLGNADLAQADLAMAIELSPRDLAANRRMLAWGAPGDRLQAARRLVAQESNVSVLRAALSTLAENGSTKQARIDVYDTRLSGWVAWDSDAAIEITMRSTDGTTSTILTADPFHPLSSKSTSAAAFDIPRSASSIAQTITVSLALNVFHSVRIAPNIKSPALTRTRGPAGPPSVIVPVYADLEATKACLESLLADHKSRQDYRILIVNDASPEPTISDLLKSLEGTPGVDILMNPFNLGFVGTINQALSLITSGDVVLLNADTIVPPGFVARLAEAAQMSDDIGTVVPLSNNGEFSSFPTIYSNNRLPTHEELLKLDRIASTCNAGKILDIPTGTGFCLYITRTCLDATGHLSEGFQRGYLEDVDFCLRAREHGFRNVCAPSIYVGHAGSRSFAKEKRLLVLRNLDVLVRRFPSYISECSAFLKNDTLRPARASLERALPPPLTRPVLVLTSDGALESTANERVRQLEDNKTSCIMLRIGGQTPRSLSFSRLDGEPPQSLTFRWDRPEELTDLREYLSALAPTHCEIFTARLLPSAILTLFDELKIPLDVWIVDGSQLSVHQRGTGSTPRPNASAHRTCRSEHQSNQTSDDTIVPLLSRTRRMLAPTPMAREFLKHVRSDIEVSLAELPSPALQIARTTKLTTRPKTLAIFPAANSAKEYSLIDLLCRSMRDGAPQISIVVAGTTFNDLQLVSLGNTFVTGPIEPDQPTSAIFPYHVRWILTGFGAPLFGHPTIEAARKSRLPVASFDWSYGALKPRKSDLAIDPALPLDMITRKIVSWVTNER